jgi:hypothetical protein
MSLPDDLHTNLDDLYRQTVEQNAQDAFTVAIAATVRNVMGQVPSQPETSSDATPSAATKRGVRAAAPPTGDASLGHVGPAAAAGPAGADTPEKARASRQASQSDPSRPRDVSA